MTDCSLGYKLASMRDGMATLAQPENGTELPGGRRGRLANVMRMAGPAFVASVAYVDPGNYATNIQAGARYGYALLWVVLLANVVAMFFQALSARVGIVSGRNLAELCRDRYPGPLVIAMWIGSEAAAMATDLAEFIGAAVGLSLLMHLALLPAMGLTAIVTLLLLTLQNRGMRPLELLITGLVAVISLSYLMELFIVPVHWGQAARGSVVPTLPDGEALTLCIGLVGATVMPHAIFLHSSLTQGRVPMRSDADRRRMIRFSNREVLVALGIAGLVNMAMVVVTANFHGGHSDIATLEGAYRTLTPLLGGAAAGLFLLSLLASGLSSSLVATLAGQVVMQGFVRFRIPVTLRRVVTVLPSFAVIACGVDPTSALVLSQVVLSFVLPVPMITLLLVSRDPAVMGTFRLGGAGLALHVAMVMVIVALNVALLAQTAGLLPG
ncbi:Nramp family divalent metal transporter [Rhizosaccharibacter radicis]|uniref:Nramp family divalent metal transporter n=1 Tax=Rhizosaccharibacter radicis TaxID=2782605 RepID=A0ABT1W2E7_9PROT|nr:Nramp family divalent metal transporter [Acetobacteraceae bacterium KSS12]